MIISIQIINKLFDCLDVQNTKLIHKSDIVTLLNERINEDSEAASLNYFPILDKIKDFNKTFLTYSEFTDLIQSGTKILQKKELSEDETNYLWNLFDKSETGKIGAKELIALSDFVGIDISNDQLVKLLEIADLDNDGYIGYDDFKFVLQNRNN